MKYKAYQGQVTYDEEAKIFHGEVIGLRDVVTFQGTSVDELEQSFKDSVDEYLSFCKELGRTPEKPFSGNLMLRLPPELHERAAYEARCSGVSLNAWLKQGVQKLLSSPPLHKPSRRKHVN
ncbi:MAG: type II toxin-antitoxin system HicB family antitoxin [Chlamydiales bacterium]|nr:type II toxin-antitoxin system HicB family antitoxin [Chlamydiales bacterium]MBY0529917.1 type II toxin-antitoxin system HicB family antitoxin [Rhabdochlamydiaceae bacterium]